MSTKPTAAAMRAANAVADIYCYSPDNRQLRMLAAAIDRHTGLPELIETCEAACDYLAEKFGGRKTVIGETINAALSKARGE